MTTSHSVTVAAVRPTSRRRRTELRAMTAADHVADSPNGANHLVADLAAHVVQMHLDGVAVDFGVPAVHGFLQPFARQHGAGIADQGVEDLELAVGEVDVALADANHVRRRVELDVAAAQHRRAAAVVAAHQGPQACRDLADVGGLDEVVVGAAVEHRELVADVAARGQHQYRHGAALVAVLAYHAGTIAVGQAEVEDGGVEALACEGMQAEASLPHPVYGEAG